MLIRISEGHSLGEIFKTLPAKLDGSDEVVYVELSEGVHYGLEHERIYYNLPNILYIDGKADSPEKCVLKSENCEAFHKDTENRAVLTLGPMCTKVELKNFTIENTHIKTADDVALGNQAEALCWHNQTGHLYCENMRFISRQDTIHVKGVSHFKSCYVAGDVDFIWGYCKTSVFQWCTIHTIKDNRGDDRDAYVLQSRALNGKLGFIFLNCDFTAEDRGKNARIYIGRSQGTGKPDSVDRWDSIALINCTISEEYDKALWTDENGTRAVYPEKGSAMTGWRQFDTRIKYKDGTETEYNPEWQEKHGYTMNEDDFYACTNAM